MQASVGNLREVMVLIVVPNIVCQRIEGPIVAIRLLALRIGKGQGISRRNDKKLLTGQNKHSHSPAKHTP